MDQAISRGSQAGSGLPGEGGATGDEAEEDAIGLAMADADLQNSLSDCCNIFPQAVFDDVCQAANVDGGGERGRGEGGAGGLGRGKEGEAGGGDQGVGEEGGAQRREEGRGGSFFGDVKEMMQDGKGRGEGGMMGVPSAGGGGASSAYLLSIPDPDPFQVRLQYDIILRHLKHERVAPGLTCA